MNVLGISGLFHDSAAAVVSEGKLVAAAQEERFSRRKHDSRLPEKAIGFCLEQAGIEPGQLDHVVFYEKPISAMARSLKSLMAVAPRGFGQFTKAVPSYFGDKIMVEHAVEGILDRRGHELPGRLLYTEHHGAHAASAFYPSPFESAAVITLDGVGEWATVTIGHGTGDRIVPVRQLRYPHSIGLLYSSFTHHCGFRVNGGEYKLMGLAPYGEPTYREVILDELVDLRDDGSFHLNLRAFGFLSGLTMTNRRFEQLFDGPARDPEAPITRREVDLARSIQVVTEEIIGGIADMAAELTGERNACLAGGVALNAVANGRLLSSGPFDDVWVQPCAGDAGGAVGAAFEVWHRTSEEGRRVVDSPDGMSGCLLGPAFDDEQVDRALATSPHSGVSLDDEEWAPRIAGLLASGAVVGLFDGRMEFGPRALGGRSILADPRSPEVAARVNAHTKKREGFRPFAPAILEERAGEWFETDRSLPYMTFVVPVHERHRRRPTDDVSWPPEDRLRQVRSDIPAVTHVDHSARVQTVSATTSPRFHALLSAFEEITGCPVLLNTSLNTRGEPMACSPADALSVFETSDLDHLVLGNRLVSRP